MTEPPNTEALLATVREALTPSSYEGEYVRQSTKTVGALAALDAIASELERLRALVAKWDAALAGVRELRADYDAALIAEAELERTVPLIHREQVARRKAEAELDLKAHVNELLDSANDALAARNAELVAELVRVRAERDSLQINNHHTHANLDFCTEQRFKVQARLVRAVEALRFYAELGEDDIPYADTINDPPDIGRVARAALTEIEESMSAD